VTKAAAAFEHPRQQLGVRVTHAVIVERRAAVG
jgi:hypothetical protein